MASCSGLDVANFVDRHLTGSVEQKGGKSLPVPPPKVNKDMQRFMEWQNDSMQNHNMKAMKKLLNPFKKYITRRSIFLLLTGSLKFHRTGNN